MFHEPEIVKLFLTLELTTVCTKILACMGEGETNKVPLLDRSYWPLMGAGRQTVGFLHGCGLGNATHAPEDRLVSMAALTVLNVVFFFFKELMGWRDGSSIKSNCCSSRAPV